MLKNSKLLTFSIFLLYILFFLILGITLTILGSENYREFIEMTKFKLTNIYTPPISQFVYGIFSLVMFVLIGITFIIWLYSNKVSSKK